MTALAEFLLARIAEDEEAARAATSLGYGWDADGLAGDVYASGDDPQTGTLVAEAGEHADAAHIARHDPARVLAECEAKRRIVDAEQREVARTVKLDGPPMPELRYTSDGVEIWRRALREWQRITPREHQAIIEDCTDPAPSSTVLRLLALPYADHPDFREEWRP